MPHENQPPAAANTAAPPGTDASTSIVEQHTHCFKCGYDLHGLPIAGPCPECGAAVADSLRGFLLQFAAPAYQATLRSGLSYILNGILLMIIATIVAALLGIGAGFLAGRGGFSASGLSLIVQGLSLIPTALVIVGYWRFSEPDPQFEATEQPRTARRVMRITVALSAVLALAGFIVQVLGGSVMVPATGGGPGGGTPPAALAWIALTALLMLAVLVVWAAQFFATMQYTRWLAKRVPDAHIEKRAKVYMWLLPVLYVFGWVLLGLGPLIALIMYWNLLDRLRKHMKAIIATGQPAALKGALA